MVADYHPIKCSCGREYNRAVLAACPACGARAGAVASGVGPVSSAGRVELARGVPQARVTTLPTLPGYEITELLGVVTNLSANSGWTAKSKGNNALDQALSGLRSSAAAMGATAIVGLTGGPFGAHGGVTSGFGGDAVGILLMGTAVRVRHLGDLGAGTAESVSPAVPAPTAPPASASSTAAPPTLGGGGPERGRMPSDSEKAQLAAVPPEDRAADWYRDPLGQASERFWNGVQWTGRLRD